MSVKNLLISLTDISKEHAETLLKLNKFEDKEFLYETIWLIKERGYEEALDFITKDDIFENPLLDKAKQKFYTDMNIYKTRVEVEAGEKCRKCGSVETISVTKQTRSGDEISSIKIICLNCRFRWTVQ